ncbi:hypothetical protein QL996_04355 [Planococcus sp. APC 4015]|nr:hypothetical protein [Planococcus sp. APC 4015]
MKLLKFSRQGAKSVKRSARATPAAEQSLLRCRALLGSRTFNCGPFLSLSGTQFRGFSLCVPAPFRHVTRLTWDPNAFNGLERTTAKCLRALIPRLSRWVIANDE